MEVQNIKLSKIKLGKNSRLDVKETEIAGLMESIKEIGLLQPIGVVKRAGGTYEVAYGNRRFMALSKLGVTSVPAVVKDASSTQEDLDIQNLAENVQRKNISLNEVGRYIEHLTEAGLSAKEIAVRLGVARSYIDVAWKAFKTVPKSFRHAIETNTATKTRRGKISLSTVNKIESLRKAYSMTVPEKTKVYEAAKTPGFDPKKLEQYVQMVKEDIDVTPAVMIKDTVGVWKHMTMNLQLPNEEYERIYTKYVDDGPFKSVAEVFRAKLTGKLTELKVSMRPMRARHSKTVMPERYTEEELGA